MPAILSFRSTPRRKLRLLPLLAATYFMVAGGPYGLEDIIGKAGYGWALIILAVLPFFWSLPTALMIGELAACVPEEGGFYAWVRRALGPFWGFQEAWLSLAASVFDMAIYPTLFVTYLGQLAPSFTSGHRGLAIELGVVLIAMLWNLRGAVSVGEGSVLMWIVGLSPFAVLIVAAVRVGMHHAHAALGTATVQRDLAGAMIVAMWNYMGWDNASTIAGEVDDPQRTYPRVMLLAGLMTMLTYTVPVAAVWFAGIAPERFVTGAWVDAGRTLLGPVLALAIVATGAMDNLGTFNALTMSYTRLPYALARDGLLPGIFARRLSNGVPWVALVACATGWALALGLPFERLITIDLVLWGMSVLLEFIALVVLRVREPGLLRPFRVPGPTWIAVVLGVGPALLVVFALWVSRTERTAGMPAMVFALLIAAAGLPLFGLVRLRLSNHR
jgi:amino acid transporter